ncbi:hypothetical protein VD0004_g8925 [Verticillium dahliae]|uniref:NmrA-like domain-containing protein n=1 Tax=Verticillium dahliae TaxID=27337 RepID=A0A366PBT6_VERDA|nr:hypothetical protein VdG1_00983 [Verticillium dahliae VDG1]PNH37871.1 hypothetical protein VD0004_g8925 [Verticillium dahliae]PNH76346.1 hypothetical protein VD0001_g1164 [Verticillium dahliae]RBQ89385.1 hypothetical protein VDGD_07647 [Verticillium dahliae]RXG42068.1 hypothetical protein VDGE_07647 [Verticillium dahliae]
MVVIAVAGGTGNVGRTIVQALVATGKHEVKILSRKSKRNPELEKELGAAIIPVDYVDVAATTKVLEANNVHTVVSAITMMLPDGSVPPEEDLIRAADASKTTKRIISSGWGIPHSPEQIKDLPSVAPKLNAEKALQNVKDLEYTIVHNGFFLDYWTSKPTNMTPMTLIVDIANKAAAVPGDGNTPIAFTHTTDVAKFVAALVEADKWEAHSTIVGDKVSWNEFVKLAEDAQGSKFNIAYDSAQDLKNGKVTELPGHVHAYQFIPKEVLQGMCCTFGLWFAGGAFDLTPSPLASSIQTLKVKEALEYK